MEEDNFSNLSEQNSTPEPVINVNEQLPQNVQSADASELQTERIINIREIISLSWRTFKKNTKFLLLLMLCYIVINIIEATLQKLTGKNSGVNFLILLATFAANIFVAMGVVRVFLKVSRGQEAQIKEIIGDKKYLWKYLGGSLLYVLIVGVGYLLLIIPGVIWQIKYSLWPYLVIDKDMSPMQAIKESGRLIHGFKWKYVLLQLAILLIVIIGLLCLGVGVIVSFVVASLSMAFFYRILIGENVALKDMPRAEL